MELLFHSEFYCAIESVKSILKYAFLTCVGQENARDFALRILQVAFFDDGSFQKIFS